MSHAGSPLPDFETGFTPWDEFSSYFESDLVPEPSLDQPVDFLHSSGGSSSGSGPTCYHAGLDTSPEEPNRDYSTPDDSSSGSDPTRYHAGLDSPSHGLNRVSSSPEINSPSSKTLPVHSDPIEEQRPVSIMEERKSKRKLSNRESARRSRMRKRTELENIRGEVNRLKIENRHWGNQLRFVNHYLQTARMDNNRLRVESLLLQTKLTEIAQILHFQATQQSYAYLQ